MGTNDWPDPHDVVHAALKRSAPTVTMSRVGLMLIGLKHAQATHRGAHRVKLRVATWNMDHWKRMRDDPTDGSQRAAWDYLASLGADVALVQEAVPPPFLDPGGASLAAGVRSI